MPLVKGTAYVYNDNFCVVSYEFYVQSYTISKVLYDINNIIQKKLLI